MCVLLSVLLRKVNRLYDSFRVDSDKNDCRQEGHVNNFKPEFLEFLE